jgi:hypothetical protein
VAREAEFDAQRRGPGERVGVVREQDIGNVPPDQSFDAVLRGGWLACALVVDPIRLMVPLRNAVLEGVTRAGDQIAGQHGQIWSQGRPIVAFVDGGAVAGAVSSAGCILPIIWSRSMA